VNKLGEPHISESDEDNEDYGEEGEDEMDNFDEQGLTEA